MRFYLSGNHLAVDFANTVVSPDGAGDTLRRYEDLIAFLVAAGGATRQEARRLRAMAEADPRGAAGALAAARGLREALRAIFGARAEGRALAPEWIEVVNGALAVGEGREALVPSGRGFRRRVVPRREGPESALVGIARAAAEVIEAGERARVRRCGHPACVLYFLDTSRTGRRRWCSMAVCGNRMKAAAFARRARAGGRKRPAARPATS
ncbi:MAG TPA: ABATE domain-containing protein [Thermodesulfobacteriota bacterium]